MPGMRYQPQGKAILRGVGRRAKLMALPHGNTFRDVVTGQVAELYNITPSRVSHIAGGGLQSNSSDRTQACFGFNNRDLFPIGSNALSIFAIAKLGDLPVAPGNESGGGECIILRNEADNGSGQFALGYFPNHNTIRFIMNTTNDSGWKVNDTVLQTPGDALLVIHATWLSAQSTVNGYGFYYLTYRDMRGGPIYQLGSPNQAGGVGRNGPAQMTCLSGARGDYTRGWPGPVFMAGSWNESHSLQFARELVANPWMLFEDKFADEEYYADVLAAHRALVTVDGMRYQIKDAWLGLGAPYLVMSNAKIVEDYSRTGRPLVYENGGIRELRPGETIII